MDVVERLKNGLFLANDAIFKNSPRWIDLQIVHKCNLKCVMCNSWERKTEHPDISILKSIIDKFRNTTTKRINLWGGEPYLREDIGEVFKYIKESGMQCKVTTNGTLFTEKTFVETLKYVDNITFSIDSAKSEIHDEIRGQKGCLNKTLKNLRELDRLKKKHKQKKPFIEIDCTVQKLNIEELDGVLKLAEEFDASINFDPVQLSGIGNNNNPTLLSIEHSKIIESFNQLIELKREYDIENSTHILELCKQYMMGHEIHSRCIGPYINTLVDINGDVQFCWGWDKVVGNVFDNSLDEIWKNEEYVSLRKKVEKDSLERCKQCCFSHTRFPFKSKFFGKMFFGYRD